jgi:hypothetical protein
MVGEDIEDWGKHGGKHGGDTLKCGGRLEMVGEKVGKQGQIVWNVGEDLKWWGKWGDII